jgi:hypothetical protein
VRKHYLGEQFGTDAWRQADLKPDEDEDKPPEGDA